MSECAVFGQLVWQQMMEGPLLKLKKKLLNKIKNIKNRTKKKKYKPIKVPKANGMSGTPITGAVIFINQLGKNGVTLKNII